MYCNKCGAQIPDNVSFCQHCGERILNNSYSTPVQIQQTGIISVSRTKASLFFAAKYIVYIDNIELGTLENGDTLKGEVTTGTHKVDIYDKSNMNKPKYSNTVNVPLEGVLLSFQAALKLDVSEEPGAFDDGTSKKLIGQAPNTTLNPQPTGRVQRGHSTTQGKKCPKCGGQMVIQTVSESKKTGCGTILLYLLLAITILGLFVLIPLLLRKKSETVTYAVCQNCGHKVQIKRR